MSSFRNMEGCIDRFASVYARPMSHFPPSDNLLGFSCNNTAEVFHDFTKKKGHENSIHNYPSPPPTHFKQSVPLPSLQIGGLDGFSDYSSIDEGSESADSPMEDSCSFADVQTPLSPPPTLPTPTHALPASDTVDGEPFPALDTPQHDDLQVSTSFSRLVDDTEGDSDLLSPLSPDWDAGHISDMHPISPDGSVLLGEQDAEFGDNYSMVETVDRNREDGSCRKKGGLWTPRRSPVDLTTDFHLLSPSSSPSALPLYTELPAVPPYPQSPVMYSSYLPPMDNSPWRSPETPSRRSFKSLPQLSYHTPSDFDESDMGTDTLMVPPSPSSPTLALPGADMDDDFSFDISSDFESAGPSTFDHFPSSSSSSSSGLSTGSKGLLLDDPDVPAPRSPSPDNFDLDCILLAEYSDPDIQRLVELRRRSLEDERTAKSLERSMLDEGWIVKSNEARRTRKRAKERCKELSAMLRLSLGEKGVVMPSIAEDEGVKSVKKEDGVVKKQKEVTIVKDMQHLVARMMFRRRELENARSLSRSLPRSLEIGGNAAVQRGSPLRQSWIYDDNEHTEDDDEELHEDSDRGRSEDAQDGMEDDDIEMETGLSLSAFALPDMPNIGHTDYVDPPWSMMVDSSPRLVGA